MKRGTKAMFGVMNASTSSCAFTDGRIQPPAGGKMTSAFGVTAPDGTSVGRSMDDAHDGGADDDGAMRDKKEAGVLNNADDDADVYRIADPDVVGSTLDMRRWPDGSRLLFSTTAPLPATVVVGTRPPQFQGARVTPGLLDNTPSELHDLTEQEDGMTVPLFLDAEEAYATLRADMHPDARDRLPPAAIRRGRPPGVFDNTQLWPLPKLCPVLRDSKPATGFVRCTTDGVYDVLAWFAWSQLLTAWRAVSAASWRGRLVRTLPALYLPLAQLIHQARAKIEYAMSDALTLSARIQTLMMTITSFRCVLEEDARQAGWARLAQALVTAEAQHDDQAAVAHAISCLPGLYAGASFVLAAVQDTGVSAQQLVRASVWTQQCAQYMFCGPQPDEAELYTRPPATKLLAAAMPLAHIAFAGACARAAQRLYSLPPAVATGLADRICGGERFIHDSDMDLLNTFLALSLHGGLNVRRCAWIAQHMDWLTTPSG